MNSVASRHCAVQLTAAVMLYLPAAFMGFTMVTGRCVVTAEPGTLVA
jgi:hypothetical protein